MSGMSPKSKVQGPKPTPLGGGDESSMPAVLILDFLTLQRSRTTAPPARGSPSRSTPELKHASSSAQCLNLSGTLRLGEPRAGGSAKRPVAIMRIAARCLRLVIPGLLTTNA